MTDERPFTVASAPESVPPTRHLERCEQELSYITEITHALATAVEEREILGLVVDRLRMFVDCEAAAVVGVAPESAELVILAAQGVDPAAARARGGRFDRVGTIVEHALRDARPLLVRAGAQAEPDAVVAALLGEREPAAGVVVPVRGAAGVELGGLVVLNPREPAQPADLRFLLALADHAAVAIGRMRSARTRSDDAVRLRVMSTVLQAVGAGLEEEALIRRAMEALLAAFPVDAAEVVFPDGGELRPMYVYRSDGGRLGGARVQALHRRTIERGEATVVTPEPPVREGAVNAASLACFPVQARDRVLGSLLVARRASPYDRAERELLAAVGRHIGTAIELSRLFRRAAVEADQLERVAAERSSALQATQEQLARSQWLASLGEIAAGVAHDLNNALNPIVAFAELIKEHGDQPEKVRTYADRILMAAQAGAETVRRIQRFTRRRLGAMPFQPIAVAALVRDAVELIRPTLAERRHPIEVVESVEPRLLVHGNPGELRQALLNLITNAIDAMPGGGVLRFVARAEGDRVVIAVQDTGTGMAPEIQERAVEPFFTTKGARGTGLGLAEVFGIARRHGGSLELESWPDVGTTVLMRLPPASTPPEPAPERRRIRPAAARTFRILVVDDNVLGLEATAASLRAAGHAVVTAPTAEAALRVFRPGEYDVVLSDLGLPDMSGWDLLDRLRLLDAKVRLGVITGWSVPEGDETLGRRGIEIVLNKPVDPDQLLSIL